MKIIKTKLFKSLLVSFIIGIFIGIICFILLSSKEKISLSNNLTNYINLIHDGNFKYFPSLIKSFISNYKYLVLIWIFGIIFFCSLLIPFIIIYRGILLGFTISSIIYVFHIKGILYSLIMMIPSTIINEFIFILISYYSITFSTKCFNVIKKDKTINLRQFIKNYFYIFLVLSSCILLSSVYEIYIGSNIIKFVV